MDKYYQYDQRTIFPEKEIFDESQMKSGQGGILLHRNDWQSPNLPQIRGNRRGER
jgi:hypothetical protein